MQGQVVGDCVESPVVDVILSGLLPSLWDSVLEMDIPSFP
jgi:hypothetical protein